MKARVKTDRGLIRLGSFLVSSAEAQSHRREGKERDWGPKTESVWFSHMVENSVVFRIKRKQEKDLGSTIRT